jgi:hypothetical protein
MDVAVVFISQAEPAAEMRQVLSSLPGVQNLPATLDVCRSFQVLRVPALIVYSKTSEDMHETARAFGDKHVLDLARQL